jgi:hypothetical protein
LSAAPQLHFNYAVPDNEDITTARIRVEVRDVFTSALLDSFPVADGSIRNTSGSPSLTLTNGFGHFVNIAVIGALLSVVNSSRELTFDDFDIVP